MPSIRTLRRTAGCIALAACAKGDASGVAANQHRPAHYDIGHAPAPSRIAALDIDANGAGVGLPAGQGTPAEGAPIFAQKCAACHGPRGEGIPPNPRLIGRTPAAGFDFSTDATAPHTMANYWPYATTAYDYIHRAMPLNAPGSLTPSETYALVAFLLAENGVVPAGTVIDARSLPAVKMPARAHFVRDDRAGGASFR